MILLIFRSDCKQCPAYGSSDGNGSWYYFDSNGKPKYLKADATSMSKATVRINGQSYFFDEYGKMQYGLIGMTLAMEQSTALTLETVSLTERCVQTSRPV